MGFEIKNICTVVPNPYHQNYSKNDGYYYFSLFITPRLQFDGTLKEFYEMLHWPEYAEKIFWESENQLLKHINLVSNEKVFAVRNLQKDDSYIRSLCKNMQIIKEEKDYDEKSLRSFLEKGKVIWKKLFHENVPVEAWPIYLKPQTSIPLEKEIQAHETKIISLNEELNKLWNDFNKTQANDTTRQKDFSAGDFSALRQEFSNLTQEQSKLLGDIESKSIAKNKEKQKLENLKKTKKNDKHEITKYRQEFHKKISALARYPHILRTLGLIQDFKVAKSPLINFKEIFSIKLNVDSSAINYRYNSQYPLDELFKSVQFIRPFTRCEITNDKRLRSYVKTPDYSKYVSNGYLKTSSLSKQRQPDGTEIETQTPVFTIDQEYFEDKSADFANSSEINKKSSNVVGVNSKTFSDEDIQVLKQKVADKPKISKGFSIKVHGQPGDILTSMDQQFEKITDDNIEDEKSAFMAHHLDCGYRVDVKLDTEKSWRSLCKREAKYKVDFSEDNWFTDLFESKKLFDKLEDEPWIEEVRQVDEDGNKNRFAEVARWNGWSLTCPPLYKNRSAPNKEADDMELENIKPVGLPKLRFGEDHQYQFRIRTVDICGNGPESSDACDDSCILSTLPNDNKKIVYKRQEEIGPPLFFPTDIIVKNLDSDESKREINLKYKGEDNETLVVRSRVDNEGNTDAEVEKCIRFLTPQHITANFAEVSGQYENIAPKELFDFLKQVPQQYYRENEIKNEIPFAIDNLVSGFKIIELAENGQVATLGKGDFMKVEGELKKKPVRITLNETELNGISNTIALSKGDYKSLQIISLKTNTKINSIAEESSAKDFRIIHAVQRPVFINNNQKPTFVKIGEESFCSNLLGSFLFEKYTPEPSSYKDEQKYQITLNKNLAQDKPGLFPFTTTGEIIINAEYTDFELNPLNENGWSYISKNHPKEVDKDHETGTNKPAEADKFYVQKSWSNLDESTENNKLDTLLNDDVKKEKIENDFEFFKHTFPDTKFRKVKYTLEAVSKFSEFFDIKAHEIGKNDQRSFSLLAILNPEADNTTIIKNSAKPSKPKITSIVPVFTIINPEDNKGTYTFEHKTFRIYLGHTWYETGLEEKIAVTYINDNPSDEVLKNKVSILANDPTTSKDSLNSNSIYDSATNTYIDSARVGENLQDSLNLEIIASTIDSLKSNNRISDKITRDQMKEFGFSTFEVRWDTAKGEFYAEIEIKQENVNHYSTLLKFGVCRYQEHSIVNAGYYDYRFSDVVMTDMVSILPIRNISKVLNQTNKFRVTGNKGGRYIFKNGNHDSPIFNSNKIYLVSEEKQIINDGVTRTYENVISVKPKDFDLDIEIDIKKYKTHFIEEYEDIPLDDDFYIEENTEGYNPRNDPRKRLVFFYKIRI